MAAKETLFREIGEKCSNNYKLCVILYKMNFSNIQRIFPNISIALLLLSIFRRSKPSHLLEELSEMGLRGEAEGIGYLLHRMRSGG